MSILIKSIQTLVQTEEQAKNWVAGTAMAQLPIIDNAFLCLKDA